MNRKIKINKMIINIVVNSIDRAILIAHRKVSLLLINKPSQARQLRSHMKKMITNNKKNSFNISWYKQEECISMNLNCKSKLKQDAKSIRNLTILIHMKKANLNKKSNNKKIAWNISRMNLIKNINDYHFFQNKILKKNEYSKNLSFKEN